MTYNTKGLPLTAGYTEGQSGWSASMNRNLELLGALANGQVTGRFADEPATGEPGDAYIRTTDNRVGIRVIAGDVPAWVYVLPIAGWTIYDNTTGELLLFKDGAWTALEFGGGDGGGDASYPPFEGKAGKVLKVNAEEDGVVWATDLQGTGGGGGEEDDGIDTFILQNAQQANAYSGVGYVMMRNQPVVGNYIVGLVADNGTPVVRPEWTFLGGPTASNDVTGSLIYRQVTAEDTKNIQVLNSPGIPIYNFVEISGDAWPEIMISQATALKLDGPPAPAILAKKERLLALVFVNARPDNSTIAFSSEWTNRGIVATDSNRKIGLATRVFDSTDNPDLSGITWSGSSVVYSVLLLKPTTKLTVAEPPLTDAPSDGKFYARRNGAWVAINVQAV